MLDSEFKSNVVKVLREIVDRLPKDDDYSFDDEDKTPRTGDIISVIASQIIIGAYHNGNQNYQVDLDEIFEPLLNSAIAFNDDDTTINYSIQGQNAISATISNRKELNIPSTDSSLSSYDLTIRISTELFDEPVYVDRPVTIEFT